MRKCRECGGAIKFLDVDDVSITLECTECFEVYTVEPDGLGDCGLEWVEAIAVLNQDPDTGEPLT